MHPSGSRGAYAVRRGPDSGVWRGTVRDSSQAALEPKARLWLTVRVCTCVHAYAGVCICQGRGGGR